MMTTRKAIFYTAEHLSGVPAENLASELLDPTVGFAVIGPPEGVAGDPRAFVVVDAEKIREVMSVPDAPSIGSLVRNSSFALDPHQWTYDRQDWRLDAAMGPRHVQVYCYNSSIRTPGVVADPEPTGRFRCDGVDQHRHDELPTDSTGRLCGKGSCDGRLRTY